MICKHNIYVLPPRWCRKVLGGHAYRVVARSDVQSRVATGGLVRDADERAARSGGTTAWVG